VGIAWGCNCVLQQFFVEIVYQYLGGLMAEISIAYHSKICGMYARHE
jgi:hypothetical protein